MKKKDIFMHGICLRAVLLFCALFAFSSCSDNEEETTPPAWGGDGGSGNQPAAVSIAGNWLSEEESSGYYLSQLYIFGEDGNYRHMICEVAGENTYYETSGGSYYVSGDRLTLVEEWNDMGAGSGGAKTHTILSLTSGELVLSGSEDDVYTFERTTRTTLPEPPVTGGAEEQGRIVGNWYQEDFDYDYTERGLWVFRADGTFSYSEVYEDSYGRSTYKAGGNYTYADGRLTVEYDYSVPEYEFEGTDIYDVPVLTDDRLVLREDDGDTYVYERSSISSLFSAHAGRPAGKAAVRTNRLHRKGMGLSRKH